MMESIHGYYNGEAFVPIEKVSLKKNRKVIITLLDEFVPEVSKKPYKKYVGKLDDAGLKEISAVLKDCDRVDYNEW